MPVKQVSFLSFIGLCLVGGSACADVTIERTVKFGGFAGIGAFDSKEVEYFSGDKQRVETTRKFTGAILGSLMPDAKTTRITRVDKDLVWEVDEKKGTYTEHSIGAAMAQMKAQQEKQKAATESRKNPDEKPKFKIVRNDLSLTKTNETKSLAGYTTTKYVMRWEIEAEDLESKQHMTYTMVSDQWTAPEDATLKQARKEQQAFMERYVKKLTGDSSFDTAQQFGFGALGGVLDEASMEKFKKESAKLQGFPLATRTQWSIAGDPAAATDKHTKKTDADSTADMNPQEMIKNVGSMFGGLFKKDEGKMPAESVNKSEGDTNGEQESAGLFDSNVEIARITTDSVASSAFELPAKVKKANP